MANQFHTVRFADHTIMSDLENSKAKFSNPGEAIAEFGDNSVGANATEMHFIISPDRTLKVYDNGIGMPHNDDAIQSMLMFGANEKLQKRTKNSIGQHGYGMKAAIFYFTSLNSTSDADSTKFTLMSVTKGSNTGWMTEGIINPNKKRMDVLQIIEIDVNDFREYTKDSVYNPNGFDHGFFIQMENIDEANCVPGKKRIEYNAACNYILASSYVNWILNNNGRLFIQMASEMTPTIYDSHNYPKDCDVMYRDMKSDKISHTEKNMEVVVNNVKENINIHFTQFKGMNRSDYTCVADKLYYDNNKKFGLSVVVGGIALYSTNLSQSGHVFTTTFKGSRVVKTCDTVRVQLTFGPEMSKIFLKATSNNKRETKFSVDKLSKDELNVFSQIVGEINDFCRENRRAYGSAQCENPFTLYRNDDDSFMKVNWATVKGKPTDKIVSVDDDDEPVVLVNIMHPYFSDLKMNSKSTEIDKIIRKWMIAGPTHDLFPSIEFSKGNKSRIKSIVYAINDEHDKIVEAYARAEEMVEEYNNMCANM